MLASALRFLAPRRRMYFPALLDHYQPIARGMTLLNEALKRSIKVHQDRGFQVLANEIDILEAEADKIKRHIRNHLPAASLMLVDKTLFLDYTRRQDDILNNIQEAVTWLGLGDVPLSPPLADSLVACVDEAARTVEMLRPSLMAAIDLILHGRRARSDVKSHIHDIRQQHLKVFKAKRRLIAAAYASGLEFRQIYQLMRFVEYVYRASHSAERCADLLRAMLAR
jgi:uncharacterized protein